MKIQSLKEKLSELTDPRRQYGNIRNKLEDIIVIGLCTVICGRGKTLSIWKISTKNTKNYCGIFLNFRMGYRIAKRRCFKSS